jgi:hypothetical protein
LTTDSRRKKKKNEETRTIQRHQIIYLHIAEENVELTIQLQGLRQEAIHTTFPAICLI